MKEGRLTRGYQHFWVDGFIRKFCRRLMMEVDMLETCKAKSLASFPLRSILRLFGDPSGGPWNLVLAPLKLALVLRSERDFG